jgi:hypothetical protein
MYLRWGAIPGTWIIWVLWFTIIGPGDPCGIPGECPQCPYFADDEQTTQAYTVNIRADPVAGCIPAGTYNLAPMCNAMPCPFANPMTIVFS